MRKASLGNITKSTISYKNDFTTNTKTKSNSNYCVSKSVFLTKSLTKNQISLKSFLVSICKAFVEAKMQKRS